MSGRQSAQLIAEDGPTIVGLAYAIAHHARTSGDHVTAFPALSLHPRDSPTEPVSCVYGLGLAVTTQGGNQVMLGEKVLNYGPGQSMLTTIVTGLSFLDH